MKKQLAQRRPLPSDTNRLVVTQSNDLAGSIQDMNLAEKRLVLLAAAVIRQADTELPTVRFEVNDYRRIYNVNNNNLVSELLDIVSTITTRNIVLPHGKSSRTSFSVVNTFTVVSGPDSETGRAYGVIELHRDMARFFLGLDGNFFSMPLLVYSAYRSNYALRMGEILASSNRGTRQFTVRFSTDDLKARLDCHHYTNFAQFRRRVLEPAKQENNEIGYLSFEWEEHKRGRTIEEISFTVTLKRDAWIADRQRTDISRLALDNKLRTLGFDQVSPEYYQALGQERVRQLVEEVIKQVQEREGTTRPIKNPGAYLRTRLDGEIERAQHAITQVTAFEPPAVPPEHHRLKNSQERFQLADELMVQLSQARIDHALRVLDALPAEEREDLAGEVLRDVYAPVPTLIAPHQRPTENGTLPEITRRLATIRLLERRGLVFYDGRLSDPAAFAAKEAFLADYVEDDRKAIIEAAVATDQL